MVALVKNLGQQLGIQPRNTQFPLVSRILFPLCKEKGYGAGKRESARTCEEVAGEIKSCSLVVNRKDRLLAALTIGVMSPISQFCEMCRRAPLTRP